MAHVTLYLIQIDFKVIELLKRNTVVDTIIYIHTLYLNTYSNRMICTVPYMNKTTNKNKLCDNVNSGEMFN